MATFNAHLADLRWLFAERGMQHVHSWLQQVATLPGNGTLVTIGALEMDAAATPGFTSAFPTNTIRPSGNVTKTSTQVQYGTGATSGSPPGQFR